MMLRNLLDEMMRRRLLPVAALALLVLIAAPLLFLKGAPDGAPSADAAAPAPAQPAELPARAARLLAATDADASRGGAKGTAHDPFNPPAAYRTAAEAAAAGSSTKSAATKRSSKGSVKLKQVPAVVKNQPPATSPRTPAAPSTGSRSSAGARIVSVDVRFGPKKDTKIRRAIPRYQPFYIHGKLVAVFMKYSPSRDKAVFAVAPGLHISGPVKCRVQDGACKYIDMKAGSHAWLTMITADRTVVSRRLDVVRTKARASSASTKATAASGRSQAACLLAKLVAMKPGDALVDRNACKS
jgi:hypothetical protein